METRVQKRAEETPVTRERTHEWPTYIPAVDILENDDAFTVIADMPGVDPEKIDVRFEDNELTFHATTAQKEEETAPLYREFTPGDYERSFAVSQDIDTDKIEASYTNGVLTLVLPKSATAKPRTIKVSTQ